MSTAGHSESQSPAPPTSTGTVKVTRGHSCLVCQQRKVKCDGQRPCATCTKNRVECIAKPPSAPRRRKARDPGAKQDVLQRIKKLEEELKLQGEQGASNLRVNASDDETSIEARVEKVDGQLITERGHSRYVENTLWAGLKDELFQESKIRGPPLPPVDDDRPTAEGLLFGSTGVLNLTSSHPQPVHIFQLWQKFLDNVNPLTKLFHAPTMQQLILDSVSHLETLPRSTEALFFAIYLSAANSMRDEECQSMMGETKSRLLGRFSRATEFALSNAKFLRSYDIVVLQALTLFLLSMRQQYDPQSLWLLTGLAVRSGQRIGLHREETSHGFSVFDAEIRRRLWWQIAILDSISAKLSGAAIHASYSQLFTDTKRPLNINDSDLWPTMKEAPKEHNGITEMLFCSIRCEIGACLHQSRWTSTSLDGDLPSTRGHKPTAGDKDKEIDELEVRLESKFLRFCDPSISTHLLAVYFAKSATAQMRLAAHHRYQYTDKGASLPRQEKDMLFSTAVDILHYHNLANTEPALARFIWHVNVVFPFEACIYVLGEMNDCDDGDLVRKARREVQQAYENHPELISDTGNALYFAIGNLAVRAWLKSSNSAGKYEGDWGQSIPPFIAKLHEQRQGKMNSATKQQSYTTNKERPNQSTNDDNLYQGNQQHEASAGDNLDSAIFSGYMVTDQTNPLDWDYWQSLLDGRDVPQMDQNLQGTFSYI